MAKVNLIRAGKVFAPATPIDRRGTFWRDYSLQYTKPRNKGIGDFRRRGF